MYKVHYLNPISSKGTDLWKPAYAATDDVESANAILVRSAVMHDMTFSENLLAVARAGAGVNNIPLNACADKGIVVFNTPGANANGVVELAICAMLLASRDVVGGINWVQSIRDEQDIAKKVEKGKKQFAGCEISGKRLGVIGLGAIGGPLANKAIALGMEVYGCDPFLSVDGALKLDSRIHIVKTREEIYESCDIITVHVPLMDDTRKMINEQALSLMHDGVILLNLARDLLVDEDALDKALQSGKVKRYVTDFPNERTANMDGVYAIPHLGASTEESEDNCAKMAVLQVMDFMENGNIRNSVNFPACSLGARKAACRITAAFKGNENTVPELMSILTNAGVKISDSASRTRGDYGYCMMDLDAVPAGSVIETMKKTTGVLRVRLL